MKNQKIALWISLSILGLFFVTPYSVAAETIKSFDSQITVNRESSVDVTETIVYDSEGLVKHGIFRDITPISSDEKRMSIQDVSVVDQNGIPYRWQQQSNNGDVRLKIGDPKVTFEGEKTYVIHYRATNAIAHVNKDLDEIYWNVTGNNWPFPIQQVTAQVLLPGITGELQESCYVGTQGSTEGCFPGSGQFYSRRTLAPGEGMTVAVGFPAGFVHDHIPTVGEKILGFLKKFWPFLLPLSTFVMMFRRWYRKGRDPKGPRVIIPQYDVPDNLTPMEVGIILYEKSRATDISAELIYLATKGYITIHQTDKVLLGFIHSKDYELTLLRDHQELENDFDTKIVVNIFSKAKIGTTVKLSSLSNKFYKFIPAIFKSVGSNALNKNYYKNLPQASKKKHTSIVSGIVVIYILTILLTSTFHVSFLFTSFESYTPSFLVIAIITSALVFFVFNGLMPAKTQKGVETKNYLLGLREYLKIAEKDRLEFHNAPEKKPELFEKLLPYAMIFGVERLWAKEFEGIYTVSPSWYTGPVGHTFIFNDFTRDLSSFSSSATGSLSSAPHSGGTGSGGGGFSGGGGGGGGGGSW